MRGTKNRNAFKAYIEGERLFSVISKADMAKSRKNFEKATKLDRKFARAGQSNRDRIVASNRFRATRRRHQRAGV